MNPWQDSDKTLTDPEAQKLIRMIKWLCFKAWLKETAVKCFFAFWTFCAFLATVVTSSIALFLIGLAIVAALEVFGFEALSWIMTKIFRYGG